MLEYKLWIVFFFLAAIHVTACFLNFYKIRVATKPLLLIFLSVIYATSAAVFRPLVLTALLLGFAGDTLLLFGDRNKTFFFIGTAAFGAGHITYLLSLISSVDIWGSLRLLVIAFVIIFVEPLFLFIKIKDGIPFYNDLYLDVVYFQPAATKEGTYIQLVDCNELEEALKEKKNWYVNRGLEDYWKIKKQQNENSKIIS